MDTWRPSLSPRNSAGWAWLILLWECSKPFQRRREISRFFIPCPSLTCTPLSRFISLHFFLKAWVCCSFLHLSALLLYHGRYNAFFVDLFVRKSNDVAVELYRKLGYIVYRTVLNYYTGTHEEDAYGEKKGRWKLTHGIIAVLIYTGMRINCRSPFLCLFLSFLPSVFAFFFLSFSITCASFVFSVIPCKLIHNSSYPHNLLSLLLLDMRKALPRDEKKESVIPLTHPVHPWELDEG